MSGPSMTRALSLRPFTSYTEYSPHNWRTTIRAISWNYEGDFGSSSLEDCSVRINKDRWLFSIWPADFRDLSTTLLSVSIRCQASSENEETETPPLPPSFSTEGTIS